MAAIETVGDLIAALEEYDPSTPILIGHQPSWPLAEIVAGVAGAADLDGMTPCPDCDEAAAVDEDGCCVHCGTPREDEPDTVWLVAGGHPYGRSPYAPGWIFEGGAW